MPHALIVDDDPTSRSALADLIARDGFTTSLAASLAEAREHFDPVPDLVLVDLVLPDGSGMELLSEQPIAAAERHRADHRPRLGRKLGECDASRCRRLPDEAPRLAAAPGHPDAGLAARQRSVEAGLRPPHRQLAADAEAVCLDGANRAHRCDGADHRRERNRQGAGRANAPRAVESRAGALPRGELRRRVPEPDRERALRSREGQLHRRDAPAHRVFRARERRHAVPRRSHRDATRPAGAAAARARDAIR